MLVIIVYYDSVVGNLVVRRSGGLSTAQRSAIEGPPQGVQARRGSHGNECHAGQHQAHGNERHAGQRHAGQRHAGQHLAGHSARSGNFPIRAMLSLCDVIAFSRGEVLCYYMSGMIAG